MASICPRVARRRPWQPHRSSPARPCHRFSALRSACLCAPMAANVADSHLHRGRLLHDLFLRDSKQVATNRLASHLGGPDSVEPSIRRPSNQGAPTSPPCRFARFGARVGLIRLRGSPNARMRAIRLIAIALLAWPMQSRADTVRFSDTVFPNANWSATKFLDGSFSAFQVATGGNPDQFRQTDQSMNPGESIFVVHTNSSAVYNPSVNGPSERLIVLSTSNLSGALLARVR